MLLTSAISSTEKTNDILGDNIEMREPVISILNGLCYVKKCNAESVSSSISYSQVEDEKRIGSLKIERITCASCHNCDKFCSKKDNSKIFAIVSDSERKNICGTCLDKISELIVQISESMDNIFYYWSSAGFCVRYNNRNCKALYGNYIEKNNYSLEIASSPEISIALEDVEQFTNQINLPTNGSDIITETRTGTHCTFCNSKEKQYVYKFDGKVKELWLEKEATEIKKRICRNCLKSLHESLNQFMENEKSFLVANTL